MRVCQLRSEPKLGVDAVEVVQVRFECSCFLRDVVGDVYWFGCDGRRRVHEKGGCGRVGRLFGCHGERAECFSGGG